MTYLKPDTYSEPSQRFKVEFFCKIFKKFNYFSKAFHLLTDLLTDSEYNHLSISTHWLLQWPHTMYYMIHVQNLVYYSKFRHIYALFRYIQQYCGIFRTMCNPCIFRTLSYSESWHNKRYIQNSAKAYSGIFRTLCNARILEPCHIKNFSTFRGLAYLGPETYSESYLFLGTFRHIQ